ncbi:MAG: poly-gamma-glutamate system protein [Candidatus Eisenbacteria bacterium]|nr:poly-gamma-glutamate system protein [Candidatus Eisenbacteria bacterium]
MGAYRTVSGRVLLGVSVAAVVCLVAVQRSRVIQHSPYYSEKLRASRTAMLAQQAIRDQRLPQGLVIDLVNDPNATGMIGQEYTVITTDRGVLRAKLTSTNPNFAAAFVDMLGRAGLKPGDVIAVSLTGSLPCLNIALLAAAETMELRPITISSVGSSTWGANDPEFTWLDMEELLLRKGIIRTKSIAASIGGGEDRGRGLSRRGRRFIEEAIARNGVEVINERTLEASIRHRMELYSRAAGDRPIRAAVNIGGGVASLGASINGRLVPSGLSMTLARRNFPMKGSTLQLAERGIPIIHILQVERLARHYGLPIPPGPDPEIGVGPIYFTERLNTGIAAFLLFLLSLVLLVTIRVDLAHSLLRKTRREPSPHGGMP